ncbi:uncharacterized protein LOC124537081 [Vanessa cardui]|uniref:uncharacterized protein LOC124537081 n=1 Tax=Vanessa cardui TaxID=171605 RepID=UPI001F141EC4|nr:uncharacterized protein LOC124537081 [Vanessa cardui]
MMKQTEDDPRNITESHNESASQMEVAVDAYEHQQTQRNVQPTKSRPYSNAERQKRYREKRKADKMNLRATLSQSSDDQPQQEPPEHGDQTKRRSQSNAERQRKYRKSLREKRQLNHASVQQVKKVDEAELARKRHLNKQRQSRFRARQRFQWLSTSSHRAQAERKSAKFVPTSSETDCNESSNSEPVVVKPIVHNSWLGLDTTPNALDAVKNEPNDDSSVSTEVSSSGENSSFFQFFRSIHSDYLELPASKQRLFKRKCLNYLHELLDEEENNRSIPDYTQPANALNLATIRYESDSDEDVKPVILVDGSVLPNI